ncbi:MAG TPA: methyltransferase domain-containing protein [Longimicrobiales bacterium]|nr:methyltransferase domain-containing protein [Longimicrobiales bacterium]
MPRALRPEHAGGWRRPVSAYHPLRPWVGGLLEEAVLIQHIKSIRTSGTILPASGFLVRSLAECVDFAHARNIVELGAGTGCVTRELLRRMRPDARLLSLEINPAFIAACQGAIRDPRLTLRQACATTLPEVLEQEGMDGADAVVSGLPLSIMDDDVVDRILDVSHASLRPLGRFVQYQYSLSNQPRMTQRYGDVDVGFTLLNVPPAFVFSCSGRPAGGLGRVSRVRAPLGSLYAAALAAVAMAVRTYQQF